MQVMVFISRPGDNPPGHKPSLLVLPASARASIPKHLQHLNWSYFADTSSTDALIGGDALSIEDAITRDGYAHLPTPAK